MVISRGKRLESYTMTPGRTTRRRPRCYSNSSVEPAEDDAWTTSDRGGLHQSQAVFINLPKDIRVGRIHCRWVMDHLVCSFLAAQEMKSDSGCANQIHSMFPTGGCSLLGLSPELCMQHLTSKHHSVFGPDSIPAGLCFMECERSNRLIQFLNFLALPRPTVARKVAFRIDNPRSSLPVVSGGSRPSCSLGKFLPTDSAATIA